MGLIMVRPVLVAVADVAGQSLLAIKTHAPDATIVQVGNDSVVVRAPGGITEGQRESARAQAEQALGYPVEFLPADTPPEEQG